MKFRLAKRDYLACLATASTLGALVACGSSQTHAAIEGGARGAEEQLCIAETTDAGTARVCVDGVRARYDVLMGLADGGLDPSDAAGCAVVPSPLSDGGAQ